MILKIQIISFIFSIFYGFFVHITYNISYKYLYGSKKIFNFLNSFLYTLDIVLIYFKIFYIINNGIINIYFILLTITTFLILNYIKFTKKMSKYR